MYAFLQRINAFIWGNGLIFLLLSAGMVYTLKLGFIQFRLPLFIIKNRNCGSRQFKTICMSLGAAMGTGNITGVAAAIAAGGAGAVFWLWVSAFFGMALVYAENYLGMLYSEENLCGSMAYLRKGLGSPLLAWIFALCCTAASFGMGGMVQVNSAAAAFGGNKGTKTIIAVTAFILIFLVTSGGSDRIGSAAQFLMPFVSLVYAVMCILIISLNIEKVPSVFEEIFSEVFGFKQAAGGISGYALSVGIRRGIFSNEAGLGSSPVLHSSNPGTSPETQGMWSMAEVFADTLCCTLTAVTLLCSGKEDILRAFCMISPNHGKYIFSAEMCIFAFCTLTGWYYCGETAFLHLSGGKYRRFFSVVFAFAASSGALTELKTVWTLSDIFNGLMALPNLLALLLLIKNVKNAPKYTHSLIRNRV